MSHSDPQTFYGSGAGDALVNPAHYPEEIVCFLSAESEILELCASSFSTLIECGCMDGRFLPWAHDHGKAYIGIEPVERYVTQARHTVEALQANAVMCCDGAENICAILTDHGIDPRVAMAFFPFNSIGNVSAIMPVVNALAQSDVGVCISTYQTTDLATDARRRYYERCGYEQLRCRTTQEGVCFEAIGGLCTWAYHVPYFISLAHDHGIVFTAIPFAGIGVVYFSKNLYPYEWRQ